MDQAPAPKLDRVESPVETTAKILKIIDDGAAPTNLKALEPIKKLFSQINGKEYSVNNLSDYIETGNQLGISLSRLELNIKQNERLAETKLPVPEANEPVNWPVISEVLEDAVEEANQSPKI